MACKQVTGLPGSLSQLTQGSPHTEWDQSISQPHTCSPNLNLPRMFSIGSSNCLTSPGTWMFRRQRQHTIMQAAGLARGQGGWTGCSAARRVPPTEGAATDPKSRLPVFSCQEQRWVRPGWKGSTRPRDLCNRNTAHSCRVRLSCDPASFLCSLIARPPGE